MTTPYAGPITWEAYRRLCGEAAKAKLDLLHDKARDLSEQCDALKKRLPHASEAVGTMGFRRTLR